jgi:hypothetical protein
MVSRALAVSFAFAFASAACGGDDGDGAITLLDGPAVPTDAAPAIDAALPIDAPRPDGPGACTDLTNGGPFVFEQMVAEAPPAPVGGALTPGTYDLTVQTLYTGRGGSTGPTGGDARSSLRYTAGGGMEANISANGFINIWSGTVATESESLITDFACPEMQTEFNPYTATETELRIYLPDGANATELVFTRQL